MKQSSRKTTNYAIASVIAVFVVGLLLAFKGDKRNFEVVKNLDIFFSLFKELNLSYVDEVDSKKLIRTAADNMLSSLDPYTTFIAEEDMDDFKLQTTGEYGGVGSIVQMSDTSQYIMIREIYPNLPAHQAGLRPGDLFVEVGGVDVQNKSVSQVSELLRGKPDTDVKIKVIRDGKTIDVTVHRKTIQLNAVPYSGMLDETTGYILLTSFTANCCNEVEKAFKNLRSQGAKQMVIDLRSNPGGLLDEALKMVNLFVPKGSLILNTKGRLHALDRSYTATRIPVDTVMPLVVLINRASASASEIVAGALQDHDRAVVIGQRSFGKGLVQTTRELEYNNAIKLTTSKYYIPSGRCIQALDYSHRDESGAVGYVPDSLLSEFKTAHGRKVFDGGGISPDITMEPERYSNVSVALIAFNVPFHYALKYLRKHPKIDNIQSFHISDDDFADFCKYVPTFRRFEYKSRTSEAIKSLEKAAKADKYYDENVDIFTSLSEKMKPNLEKDLMTNKKEIVELIENEIITALYYRAGGIEYNLKSDIEVAEAKKVLNDMERYRGLLDGTVESHAGDKPRATKETE
ncbi:MAG: S41 family peptidase [Marinilabiliaceae bacterium]|nr:S41 family peptidase [Marinilabiliaceae bacterium]